MNPLRRTIRPLRAALLLAAMTISLSTCGGIGGSEYSGGGTGGTGISTGAITGFGSVVVNGVHYNTNAKTKKISNGNDNSSMNDQDLFRVGMITTVRHSQSDNDAQEIEYRNNLEGVISSMRSPENTFEVLGHTVVVDNAEVLASLSTMSWRSAGSWIPPVGSARRTSIGNHSPPDRRVRTRSRGSSPASPRSMTPSCSGRCPTGPFLS
jgi:hypothetical protein